MQGGTHQVSGGYWTSSLLICTRISFIHPLFLEQMTPTSGLEIPKSAHCKGRKRREASRQGESGRASQEGGTA